MIAGCLLTSSLPLLMSAGKASLRWRIACARARSMSSSGKSASLAWVVG
jgi:hypothetical protein